MMNYNPLNMVYNQIGKIGNYASNNAKSIEKGALVGLTLLVITLAAGCQGGVPIRDQGLGISKRNQELLKRFDEDKIESNKRTGRPPYEGIGIHIYGWFF